VNNMCQIVVKEANKKFDMKKLDKAQGWNSDGYGVTWYEDGSLQTLKTMDYNRFKGILSSLKGVPAVAHLRNTTKGTTCIDNNHPFDITYGVMYHNGTITGLKSSKVGGSDTEGLAELINACEYTYVTDLFPMLQHIVGNTINRLVFMDRDGNIEYINKELGIEEDGIWYSNDYHKRLGTRTKTAYNTNKHMNEYTYNPTTQNYEKEDLVKVFVYGTLKKGLGNHKLLESSKFIGNALTVGKWAMVGKGMGFPYVLERDSINGKCIQGEVYEVNNEVAERLDILEGVPHHYTDTKVYVSYTNGLPCENVNMYVKTTVTEGLRDREYLSNWSA